MLFITLKKTVIYRLIVFIDDDYRRLKKIIRIRNTRMIFLDFSAE